jgi:Ca2+-binding EF-hand superfamily protein
VIDKGQDIFASYAIKGHFMWRVCLILVLALSFGVGTAYAQGKQNKKPGPPQQKPDIEQTFKAKDKDHDGKLSKEEFIGKIKDADRVKALEARFKAIDANNDGSITLDELKAAQAKRGQQAGKQHTKRTSLKAKTVTTT